MEISLKRIDTNFKGERCFVHARGALNEEGKFVILTQPLRLSGSDIFYGMQELHSDDGGETWSAITPCENLTRKPYLDKYEICLCDATPLYHQKTGKILATGSDVIYENDEFPKDLVSRSPAWTVFDEETGQWEDFHILDIPDRGDRLYNCGSGCCQCQVLDNGDILVPVYYRDKKSAADLWKHCSCVTVLRCSFDGKELKYITAGNELSVDVPRGLGEPSVIEYGGEYFLCLRNDVTGYVAKGSDGLNYGAPKELCFDDGTNVGNYNTQQHWIKGGGKLYLVYTRRGAGNDHVFRHRAPLFIAEFDPEKMCLIRDTEQIVIPERGARLGNFGCFTVNDHESYVIVSEWMQTTAPNPRDWRVCMKYGSDNSIFIAKLTF